MAADAPDDLRYSQDHAWLRRQADSDEATIGITHFAQEQLGDVVYLELPAPGATLSAGEPFGEIESAKTVAELFAPVSGELLEANPELEDRPELVNESPYSKGWIARIRLSNLPELNNLMNAATYQARLPQS